MNKKMQPTTFGKLAIRLLMEHDIIADDFRRSIHPASELVRAKKLGIIAFDKDMHDYEVIPLESEEGV